jgi:cell division protease FtsH
MATDRQRQAPAQKQPRWRVEGGSGDGAADGPQRPRWMRFLPYLFVAIALFGLNFWIASRATEEPSRPRVPYSPFFLQQVRDENVKQITSKGTAIQGDFKGKETYAGDEVSRFKTEIPAFADTDALSKLLQSKGVIINAEPLDSGTPLWQTIVFGFGPTLLFLLLIFFFIRRAGNAQGMLGAFGRSRARRYQAAEGRVTFGDVAASTTRRSSCARSWTSCVAPRSTCVSAGGSRAASC